MGDAPRVQRYGTTEADLGHQARRSMQIILWGAFLATHAAFAFMGLLVNLEAETPIDGDWTLVGALAVAAAGVVTTLFGILPRKVRPRGTPAVFNFFLIRLAMAESVSIIGLAVLLMGYPWWTGIPFVLVGAACTAALFPRP